MAFWTVYIFQAFRTFLLIDFKIDFKLSVLIVLPYCFKAEIITGLKAEIREKDKPILEFSTVASTQANLVVLRFSSHGYQGMSNPSLSLDCPSPVADDDPHSSMAISSGVPEPEAAILLKDLWVIMGAKPKVTANSMAYYAPVQSLVGEDKVNAPMSSTP